MRSASGSPDVSVVPISISCSMTAALRAAVAASSSGHPAVGFCAGKEFIGQRMYPTFSDSVGDGVTNS